MRDSLAVSAVFLIIIIIIITDLMYKCLKEHLIYFEDCAALISHFSEKVYLLPAPNHTIKMSSPCTPPILSNVVMGIPQAATLNRIQTPQFYLWGLLTLGKLSTMTSLLT